MFSLPRASARSGRRIGLGAAVALLLTMLATPSAGSIAQPAVVSENPADWTPSLVDTAGTTPVVDAIAQTGDVVIAGGSFNRLVRGGTSYNRTNLVMFQFGTGAVLPYALNPNARVRVLRTLGPYVYVGGDFTSIGGVARRNLARVDTRTGQVDPGFRPPVSARVTTMQFAGNRLFVGGAFPGKLLALDPVTGANTGFVRLGITEAIPGAWGQVSVYSLAVNPAGTRLVATGNFMTVAGQPRSRFFMADLSGARAELSPWYYRPFSRGCASTHPRRIAHLQGVDWSPDGSYFVVAATGQVPLRGDVNVTVCDAVGRFNLSDDTRPVWINYTGGDSVWSVAATGVAVYAQGHFQWLDNPHGFASKPGPGAVRRRGIGAIHPQTGKALPWNPDKPAAIGGKILLATGAGLWVGSDSLRFNGEPRRGIAFCPLP